MISGFCVLVKKCFSKVRKIFLLFKKLKLCFDIQVLNPPGIDFPACCEIEVPFLPHMDTQLSLVSTLICHISVADQSFSRFCAPAVSKLFLHRGR